MITLRRRYEAESFGVSVLITEYDGPGASRLYQLQDPETRVTVGPTHAPLDELGARLQKLRERALLEGTTYREAYTEALQALSPKGP